MINMENIENILEGKLVQKSTLIRALNQLPHLLHIVDKDFKILYANDAFKKWIIDLWGATDLINKTPFELFPFLPPEVPRRARSFNPLSVARLPQCRFRGALAGRGGSECPVAAFGHDLDLRDALHAWTALVLLSQADRADAGARPRVVGRHRVRGQQHHRSEAG